jgi:hypothetical protein
MPTQPATAARFLRRVIGIVILGAAVLQRQATAADANPVLQLAQKASPGREKPLDSGPRIYPLYPDAPGAKGYKETQRAYEIALLDVLRATDKLTKTAGSGEPEILRHLAGIQTNVQFLLKRWQDWAQTNMAPSLPNPGPDPFLESLDRNLTLLKQAQKELSKLVKATKSDGASLTHPPAFAFARPVELAANPPFAFQLAKDESEAARSSRAKVLELLSFVSSDFLVKADQCRNSPAGLGRTVATVVRTQRNGEEVTGCEVWYVQNGFFGTRSAYDRFHKLSSPTDSKALAPGGYTFWVQKGKDSSDPRQFRLGGGGESTVQLDLEAP